MMSSPGQRSLSRLPRTSGQGLDREWAGQNTGNREDERLHSLIDALVGMWWTHTCWRCLLLHEMLPITRHLEPCSTKAPSLMMNKGSKQRLGARHHSSWGILPPLKPHDPHLLELLTEAALDMPC